MLTASKQMVSIAAQLVTVAILIGKLLPRKQRPLTCIPELGLDDVG